jgi:hypothetical protein
MFLFAVAVKGFEAVIGAYRCLFVAMGDLEVNLCVAIRITSERNEELPKKNSDLGHWASLYQLPSYRYSLTEISVLQC